MRLVGPPLQTSNERGRRMHDVLRTSSESHGPECSEIILIARAQIPGSYSFSGSPTCVWVKICVVFRQGMGNP